MSLHHKLIIATLAAFAAAQCPEHFFESDGHCFAVIDMAGANMTWEECRAECKLLDGLELSTDLATFENAEELEAFSITWLDESANFVSHPHMWIGVEKVDDEWESIHGHPVSHQNMMWNEGHPHEEGEHVFLEDITLVTGVNSYGRLYYTSSIGEHEHHSRCLCEAE